MTDPARLILIVEDDAKIADMLANYLHMHGFATRIVGCGLQAVSELRAPASERDGPALVLLDLMLPGLDGMGVCREVRRFSGVPLIMLTARVDEIDRLQGLEGGADDYICKPFSPREVVARVKALLRRAEGQLSAAVPPSPADASSPALAATGFGIDEDGQRACWQGQALNLTPVEFRLFRLLFSRPGQVFGRARLLEALHQDFRDVSDRAIDSHIKNLRRKIEQLAPAQGACIVSVYGVGYRFEADARAETAVT
ncbi:MAG: response regulator [Polaromonas sp.]|nr:response regulator [Polaromonas sp.]